MVNSYVYLTSEDVKEAKKHFDSLMPKKDGWKYKLKRSSLSLEVIINQAPEGKIESLKDWKYPFGKASLSPEMDGEYSLSIIDRTRIMQFLTKQEGDFLKKVFAIQKQDAFNEGETMYYVNWTVIVKIELQ